MSRKKGVKLPFIDEEKLRDVLNHHQFFVCPHFSLTDSHSNKCYEILQLTPDEQDVCANNGGTLSAHILGSCDENGKTLFLRTPFLLSGIGSMLDANLLLSNPLKTMEKHLQLTMAV